MELRQDGTHAMYIMNKCCKIQAFFTFSLQPPAFRLQLQHQLQLQLQAFSLQSFRLQPSALELLRS